MPPNGSPPDFVRFIIDEISPLNFFPFAISTEYRFFFFSIPVTFPLLKAPSPCPLGRSLESVGFPLSRSVGLLSLFFRSDIPLQSIAPKKVCIPHSDIRPSLSHISLTTSFSSAPFFSFFREIFEGGFFSDLGAASSVLQMSLWWPVSIFEVFSHHLRDAPRFWYNPSVFSPSQQRRCSFPFYVRSLPGSCIDLALSRRDDTRLPRLPSSFVIP